MADDDVTVSDEVTTSTDLVTRDLIEVDMTPIMQEGKLDLKPLERDGKPVLFEELAQLGDRLAAVERNGEWWYGDYLNYAEKHYPQTWDNLVDSSGHDEEKLARMQITAAVHAPSRRLIPVQDKPGSGLSWAKHALFNDLVQTDRALATRLMKRAAAEIMTTAQIKALIKAATAIDVESTPSEAPEPQQSSVAVAQWNASVPAADGEVLDDIRRDVETFIRTTLQNKGITPTNVSSKMSGAVPQG